MQHNHEKSTSEPANGPLVNEGNERDAPGGETIGVPSLVAGSCPLDRLVDTAGDYARQATSENTNKAETQPATFAPPLRQHYFRLIDTP